MAENKDRFKWLLSDQFSGNNRLLANGATYDTKDFGEAVVAEWVATGAAEYAKSGRAAKSAGEEE